MNPDILHSKLINRIFASGIAVFFSAARLGEKHAGMNIEIVDGQSARLYELVAPLVMKRSVLHYNHDYPFWTSSNHTWFIALDEQEKVCGFFPLEVNLAKKTAKINNYYMAGKETDVFPGLIQAVVDFCRKKYTLQAVAQMQHKALFTKAGFHIVVKEWKLYVKLEYGRKKRQA